LSTTTQRAEVPTTALSGHGAKTAQRITWLIVFAALLGASIIASLLFGSNNSISLQAVLDAFNGTASPQTSIIVFEQRIPRTIVGITCGACAHLTRPANNARNVHCIRHSKGGVRTIVGCVAVVLSVFIGGVMGIWQYMVVAVIGAAIAAAAVYVLGRGKDGSIVKLALAGVAISAALGSFTQGLILINQDAYNEFRLWVAGSLEGRGLAIAAAIGPVIAAGVLLAFFVAPAINALSMGEDAAVSLGVSVQTTQNLTLLAVTVLAGAATAAIGPISFVGLAVPFVVRALLGNDVRWVNIGSALLGPVWLLGTDVLARVLQHEHETQVGIVATLAGAPVFLFLMTRRKVEAL